MFKRSKARWVLMVSTLGLLLAGSLLAGPVVAQDEDEAQRLYERAQRSLDRERYREAGEQFRELTRQYAASALAAEAMYWEAFALYRLGDAGDLRNALDRLEELADRYGDGSLSGDREQLVARIEGALAELGDSDAARSVRERSERESNNEARLAALNALLNMDPDKAMPILEGVLKKRDPASAELREKAVWLIAQHGGENADDILLDVARNDPDIEVQKQAVFWLHEIDSDAAVDAIASILRTSKDPELLESAVFAVAHHDSPKARTILRDLVGDDELDYETRGQAIFWLGQEGNDEDIESLKKLYGELRNEELKEKVVFSVSQQGGRGAQEWLMKIALDENESIEMRKNALFWAGEMGSLRASDLRGLYDTIDEREMKEQVIFVLSQRDDLAAVDLLIEIARNEKDVELRTNAIFWLGQSDDDRALKVLEELINQ